MTEGQKYSVYINICIYMYTYYGLLGLMQHQEDRNVALTGKNRKKRWKIGGVLKCIVIL